MKVKMTVDEAMEFAKQWVTGMTFTEHSQGWRVVCMVLAEEVERLRQLEAERVPEGVVVTKEWLRQVHRDLDACQKVIWLGMRDADPSYCADAKSRLKEIDAMLAAAPAKEGE